MARRISLVFLIGALLVAGAGPSFAADKWWSTNWDGSWFESGRFCYGSEDAKIGQKFNFYYKLGTSTKWTSLGSSLAEDGLEATNAGVDPENNDQGLEDVCSEEYPISVQSPRVPTQPGAYVIKTEALDSKGKVKWSDSSNLLLVGTGATPSSYFGSVPKVSLPSYVYQNIQSGSFMTIYGAKRLVAYDLKGNPRHPCSIFYDLAVTLSQRSQKSMTAYDLQYSITQGSMGQIIGNYMGLNGGTIKAGVTCAPWVARNMP
jgi:hypothetical protein